MIEFNNDIRKHVYHNYSIGFVTIQETMARIYSEWLPSSNYEVINAPAFSFTKMDKDKKEYAYSEVWIPVRKN